VRPIIASDSSSPARVAIRAGATSPGRCSARSRSKIDAQRQSIAGASVNARPLITQIGGIASIEPATLHRALEPILIVDAHPASKGMHRPMQARFNSRIDRISRPVTPAHAR
jgi:hypothetical protein